MPPKQEPKLLRSPLTGRVYIVTRYRMINEDDDTYEAREKYDCTEQFLALAESLHQDDAR